MFGLITDKQHGFVMGKSCLSNLLETLDKVNEYMAEGDCVDLLILYLITDC